MKIRQSFVSNSSSTSFCITDCSKLDNLIDSSNIYIPYQIDEVLEVNIYCKYKDLPFLYLKFKGEEYRERHDRWYDYYNHKQNKPNLEEEDSIWGISLSSLFDKDKEVYDKITRVTFSADDYETLGQCMITLLYRFFELKGLKPDNSNSEKSMDNTNGNFLVSLIDSILKTSKDIKENERDAKRSN